VGIFEWCCRAGSPLAVRAARWLRDRVPAANALANQLRGKASDDPFIPTHVYASDEMLAEFEAAGLNPVHVAFERHEDVDYAIAFAQRRSPSPGLGEAEPASHVRPAPNPPATVPVSAAEASDAEIDAWNKAAEEYFASLMTRDHHLAKPFSQVEETPTLLASVAVLLQALRLTPGMAVLEFGAGSGWLSRFLTQMGCRMILLDVSPTALAIAREHYRRQPLIGQAPEPEFLSFDGRRIDLPDGAVDRIVCFDAFHHAPNPRTMIREFARVLGPGGIAGFVEPGPRHADAPRSQFEAHTYGVVERDVDVHDVWRVARASGFADLRMCVFHAPPYHVSLQEYEEIVAGGPASRGWLASTRTFLRHVRSFSLIKEGGDRADSRGAAGLACEIRAALAGAPGAIAIDATVTNTGTAAWLPWGTSPGGVGPGTHLYHASATPPSFHFPT